MKQIRFVVYDNRITLFKNILAALGTIWLCIEFPSFLSQSFEDFVQSIDIYIFGSAMIASIIYGFIMALPRTIYHKAYPASNTSICLKVGDLFAEDSHIVVSSSDFFDTNYNMNQHVSLKSQLIKRFYSTNVAQLDREISDSLRSQSISGTLDTTKPDGKKTRYPIGTIAVVPNSGRSIYLTVISNLHHSRMGKHTSSDPVKLNDALNSLWDKIKIDSRMRKVSMPALGSGLAGVSLSNLLITQIIILSYSIYAKNTRITDQLNIIIPRSKYNPDDFEAACRFLDAIQI